MVVYIKGARVWDFYDGVHEGHMYEAAMMVYMTDTCEAVIMVYRKGVCVSPPWVHFINFTQQHR